MIWRMPNIVPRLDAPACSQRSGSRGECAPASAQESVRTAGLRPPGLAEELEAVDANLDKVVKQGQQWRQREGDDEEGDVAELDDQLKVVHIGARVPLLRVILGRGVGRRVGHRLTQQGGPLRHSLLAIFLILALTQER